MTNRPLAGAVYGVRCWWLSDKIFGILRFVRFFVMLLGGCDFRFHRSVTF